MNIQKINLFTPNNKVQLKEHNNQTAPQMRTSNLPMMAYKDYNISFGERLFRTPANFFEQDFNRNNMPVTMKRYLFADYEDRQNMPPNQMLKLVFDDINVAESLEDVKYLFPDEPLFENLSDTPKVKARTGVIAEIEAMREDGKTLFKNGQDNLGFYILKKIYLEGKSLKEINHDFERDISVYYKGLSPIQYETLSAYGIKFPKNAFWKSFTATREDFPYEYKPRKPIEERATSSHSGRVVIAPTTKRQSKKFEDIKDWQIDKLSDALIEGNGSAEQTRRSLKRHSAGNPEALNFVAKYMGEINSVVLEKLHVSEEMKDFFENYDNLTDSQKVKFKKYWDNPDIKDLRSLVMSSTIKFFFDVYGVDGNNDEFQELLEYAHNIKAERLKREEEHNRLQTEYEELFVNYCPLDERAEEQTASTQEKPVIPSSDRDIFNNKMIQKAQELNAKIYPYTLSSGVTMSIVANYDQMLKDKIDEEMAFYPKSFKDDYKKFIQKKNAEYPKYLMSLFFNVKGLEDLNCVMASGRTKADNDEQFELFKKEYLMSADEVNKLSTKFREEYDNIHSQQCRAINQVLYELLSKVKLTPERYEELTKLHEEVLRKDNPDKDPEILHRQSLQDVRRVTDKYIGKQISSFPAAELQAGLLLFDVKQDEVRQYVESRYSLYNQPLTQKETQKISKTLVNRLMEYDANASVMDDKRTQAILKCISENLKLSSKMKDALVQMLVKQLPKKNGDFRAFLLSDTDKEMQNAMAEVFFIKYLNGNQPVMYPLLATSKDNLDSYIAPVDRDLYGYVMQYRMLQAMRR